MTASLSSSSSSLLRHHPHEHTPLLEADVAANKESLSKTSSPSFHQHEQSGERPHNASKPSNDEEERDQNGDSDLTRENENTAGSETSMEIVGVISVMLLGQ